jgi:hypothetical protein
LQRLIERASGAAEKTLVTPVLRATRQAGVEGEGSDPFEKTAPPPQPFTPPRPQVDALRSSALPPRSIVSAPDALSVQLPTPPPAEHTPEPEHFTPIKPPTALREEPPPTKSVRQAAHEPKPAFEPVQRARLTPGERPTPPDQTSSSPPRKQPDQTASNLPRIETPVQSADQSLKPTRPDDAPQHRSPEQPPVARAPIEKEKPEKKRPVPDLRPPPPTPPQPVPKPVPEQPRVVIGRLSVEVVPEPPTIPQSIPAHPVQSTRAPERSEPTSGSMLRFGLGQM